LARRLPYKREGKTDSLRRTENKKRLGGKKKQHRKKTRSGHFDAGERGKEEIQSVAAEKGS